MSAADRGDALGSCGSVYLRHARKSDRSAWCALRRESETFLEPWEPRATSPESATPGARFDRILAVQDEVDTRRHLMCRADDGVIVGMVNLSQIFYGPFCSGILGYWVGAAHAGRGYATDGVRACLSRAFGELGLHRVECNVRPENEPSIRLARRVGFRDEGYSPRYLEIAGVWADHVRFALTREEWDVVKQARCPAST